jgi:hypothetical protein
LSTISKIRVDFFSLESPPKITYNTTKTIVPIINLNINKYINITVVHCDLKEKVVPLADNK